MNDLMRVQILDSRHDLVEKFCGFMLRKTVLFHNIIEEFTTICILHDKVDGFL